MRIRISSKAIIERDGKILLNVNKDDRVGVYYAFPGGGQEMFETMEENVLREVLEETGYRARVVRFAGVHEEIWTGEDRRRSHPEHSHISNHYFICELEEGAPAAPVEQDSTQLGSEWVEIEKLSALPLYPECMREGTERLLRGETCYFPAVYIEK